MLNTIHLLQRNLLLFSIAVVCFLETSITLADDPINHIPISKKLSESKVTYYAPAPGYSEGPTWRNGEVFFCSGGLYQVTKNQTVTKYLDLQPAGTFLKANGHLLICDNKYKALLSMSPVGKLTIIANSFEGKPLNSLNDLTVDKWGQIYWTDPSGSSAKNPVGNIFRVTPAGIVTKMATGLAFPNGLDVDPASEFLYLIESQSKKILRYPISEDQPSLSSPHVFYDLGGSGGDGCTFDANGNLWVADFHRPKSTGQGRITVLSPTAKVLGHLDIPAKVVSNLTFGGENHDEIFCTTGTPPGVFHAEVGIKGFRGHPGAQMKVKRVLDLQSLPSLTPPSPDEKSLSMESVRPEGWLSRRCKNSSTESFEQVHNLFNSLQKIQNGKDINAAISIWEAIAGRPVLTSSGRKKFVAQNPLPLSREWALCNQQLLELTAQSRFGDALESTLYQAAWKDDSAPWDTVASSILGTMQLANSSILALNLFESTTKQVSLNNNNVAVHVISEFPRRGKVQLNFRMTQPTAFGVWVRVPHWANDMTLRYFDIKGESIALSGDWARLPVRTWKNADWIEITFDMQSENQTSKTVSWGPLSIPESPLSNSEVDKKLQSGQQFNIALDRFPFAPPVARPSKPLQPGNPLQPGKMFLPSGERRMFGIWQDFNPTTWEGIIGSDPPGQEWKVKILPYATFIHRRVYGSRPHDYYKGERVNVFLRAGENGEWRYVSSVQDELMQMYGHKQWWLVRKVTTNGGKTTFSARTYSAGNNLADASERSFQLAPDCEIWKSGKRVNSFPLERNALVRMMWVYQEGKPIVKFLTDDASLDAIRNIASQKNEQLILKEGIAGFVERVEGNKTHLTLFNNYWPYCHRLKPNSKVHISATDAGYRPQGESFELKLISAKVGGRYGSGPTAAILQGNADQLKQWAGSGQVVRLIPSELKQ